MNSAGDRGDGSVNPLSSTSAESPTSSETYGAFMGSVVIEQLRSDPLYRNFLEDDFDAKLVAAKAVENLAITDHLAKIAAGISLVEREIRHEVGDKYEELLSHAIDIEGLEKSLQDTFSSVKALKVIGERVQSRMAECYEKVEQHTLMLARLHDTCELARSVARLAGVCRQLRQNNAKQTKDMMKSSQLISEVYYLLANVGESIHSINAVRSHLTFVSVFRVDLIRQCQTLLESSLESQNAAQMTIALQSFHNMGILSQQLETLLATYMERLTKATKEALDTYRLSQSSEQAGSGGSRSLPGRANLGGGAAFRGNLWAAIEMLLGAVGSQLIQVAGLEATMAKRKDTNSHNTFAQIVQQQRKQHQQNSGSSNNKIDQQSSDNDDSVKSVSSCGLVESLWSELSAMLSRELIAAATQSTFVRQAFEGEYPKLIKIFTTKLESVDLSRLNFESLETAYVSRSLSRLLDCANLCLTNTPPLHDDVVAVVNVIMSEIRVTESVGDVQLLRKVSRNVAQTVAQLASRAEQTVIKAEAPEAAQVIGPANLTQKNNGMALQLLHLFSVQVSSFIDSLNCDAAAISVMASSLKQIDATISSCLAPLFGAVRDAVEAILLTMHGERYDQPAGSSGKEMQCSLYMRELTGFLQRVLTEYVTLFPPNATVQGLVREMGSRTIELFLRFISLVRPVSDAGCLRLATDCAQLETSLAPLKADAREDAFARHSRALQAFRPLLLLPAEQIAQAYAVGPVVPYSTALQFLFSRAPPEMKSPHDAASWSLQRYAQWLDQHPSEKDRLVLIRGTLDSYLRWVRHHGVKEFPPIYVVVNDLLGKAVANCV
ncbi:conserved oligomeric Golgi complex subunit 5-like [Tropilaelaps mercedesae]|uniref:Conserved oligomeric Golgi complex subunit 5 n=1 Tax=Tropilaelaps mercedesae TaxID=418985 RepID=A0A1V9XWC6_9ACAR|nr:conserved oligomeric Golgi complex subunit 5-like [Tropilaelaps mercedesae]